MSCKDEDGNDVEGKAGNAADSARRLDVDTSLPLLAGWTTALANAYLTYLSVRRRQLDETIEEPEARRVRLLDVVTRDGQTYQALRVETDFRQGTQKVQLVELEA